MIAEIAPKDVQDLSGRQQVQNFFAVLGYTTDDVTVFTPQSFNIPSQLSHQIASIARVARLSNDWTLEVFLFEMTSPSVTKQQTRELTRVFNQRGGDFLLVLTTNYLQIDFVLVAGGDDTAQAQDGAFGEPQKRKDNPYARTMTVNRRNPDRISMRVLRLFMYHDGESVFDYVERLRSAYMVSYWSEAFFNNRALFSDYYLIERLPDKEETPEWEGDSPQLRQAMKQLRILYADTREEYVNQPRSVVQERLIRPVLELLGFSLEEARARQGADRTPDYILHIKDAQAEVVGFCLAYPWQRDLDRKLDSTQGDDPNRDNDNPGAAVVTLLEQGIAKWGILTNGKSWRLYSASAHSRATNYYEIDLDEIINQEHQDQVKSFKYFWFLFRAESFRSTILAGDGTTISKLDQILQHSATYAHEVGEQLKSLIFDQIFQHFAQGFVNYARQQRRWPKPLEEMDEQERDERLQEVFNATLTFLYRLLFLLYAESRNLLPVREISSYYGYSLEHLKVGIAESAGTSKIWAPKEISNKYSESETGLYDNLKVLFSAIDKGSRDLNVPIYNGGLFMTVAELQDSSSEARTARFLSELKIPDRELALGLDLLVRVEEKKGASLVFVDYKSLGVRQLGSIYEGLLEFRLRVAREKMVVASAGKGSKKTEQVVTHTEAAQKKLAITSTASGTQRIYTRGDVYLENDKHERKATGSYYTPDYIVKYIVANTVGPVLDEKFERLTREFRQAEQDLRNKAQRAKIMRQQGRPADDPELDTYNKYRNTLNETFFDLKVLDPAMGSGHFLVEAVDYITDRMTRYLDRFSWNPVYYHLQVIRREIQQQMEEQGIQINLEKLTDINLLKRQVLKRCIYGVDLNPMAVELSKVSVWLDSFTLGAPLSFLDHHLKCGNSLIGARIREAQEVIETGQLSLFFSDNLWASAALATEGALEVARLSDATAEQVYYSKERHRESEEALAPYKRLLNVYLSRWFGNDIIPGKKGKSDIDKAIDFLRSSECKAWYQKPKQISQLNDEQKQVVDTATKAAANQYFFHWELEFPEVFFGPVPGAPQMIELKRDSGFDAVVGNPPYDELSEHALGRAIEEESFLSTSTLYKILGGGRLNWYHYFMLLALSITRPAGMHGFIVPMSLMSDQFTRSLRHWLLESHQIVSIDAFPQKDDPNKRIFYEAKLPTCIYTVRNTNSHAHFQVRTHPENVIRPDSPTYFPDLKTIKNLDSNNRSIPLVSDKGWKILQNASANPKLGMLSQVGARPTSGEIVFNQQFRKYLTDNDQYTLILRGSHVQRYELVDEAKQGEPVYLKKDLYLKDAKPGSKAFDHLKERVVYQEGAAIDNWRRVIATLLPAGLICGHKICYFVDYQISSMTLLAIFSSKLIDWFVTSLSTNNSLSSYLIGSLRFPILKMTMPSEKREKYLDKGQHLYLAYVNSSKEDTSEVLNFVSYHLSQQPEQSDIVHDLLAFLAEEMLRLNREKRTEQKRFVRELEQVIMLRPDKDGHNGIDTLKDKQNIMEYPGDYQKLDNKHTSPDELLVSLRKNKGRFGVSLDAVADQILEEYERSLGVVLPLKERLRKTDNLIDEIVYRLYGLTDEEIRVVKGE